MRSVPEDSSLGGRLGALHSRRGTTALTDARATLALLAGGTVALTLYIAAILWLADRPRGGEVEWLQPAAGLELRGLHDRLGG